MTINWNEAEEALKRLSHSADFEGCTHDGGDYAVVMLALEHARNNVSAAPAAALEAMPKDAIDWRWHYVFQTRMRLQDVGMDAATAIKAAEDDAADLERVALRGAK